MFRGITYFQSTPDLDKYEPWKQSTIKYTLLRQVNTPAEVVKISLAMGILIPLSNLRFWSQRNKKLFDFSWLPATILLQSQTAHPPAYINTKSAVEKVKKNNNVPASMVFLYPPYDCEKPQVPLWPPPSTARYTHINVWHPGYPDQHGLLFSMPILDQVVAVGEEKGQEGSEGGSAGQGGGSEVAVGEEETPSEGLGQERKAVGIVGIHYGFLITACSIFTGNSTGGFLTHDREGKDHLLERTDNWDHVLVGVTSCYFHLNRPTAVGPYPVCSSFAHWTFPHRTFPRKWLVVSILPPHIPQVLSHPNLILSTNYPGSPKEPTHTPHWPCCRLRNDCCCPRSGPLLPYDPFLRWHPECTHRATHRGLLVY